MVSRWTYFPGNSRRICQKRTPKDSIKNSNKFNQSSIEESLRGILRRLKKRDNVRYMRLGAEERDSSSRKISFLGLWRQSRTQLRRKRKCETLWAISTRVQGRKKSHDGSSSNKEMEEVKKLILITFILSESYLIMALIFTDKKVYYFIVSENARSDNNAKSKQWAAHTQNSKLHI